MRAEVAGARHVDSIRSMKTTDELVQAIDRRLRGLNDEIKMLDAARVALDGRENRPSMGARASVTYPRKSPPGAGSQSKHSARTRREISAEVSAETARRPRKRARTTSRARGRGALRAVPDDRVESLLIENGGLSTSALAEKSGANRDHVLSLLRELETAGRVRRTGQRRSTRWHVITDEDRIRERAAQLEATRKRPA